MKDDIEFNVYNVDDIQVHSFINVWLAWNNSPKERLLTGALVIPGLMDYTELEHVKDRLNGMDWNIDTLFKWLSETQRGALIRYIHKNYEGVTMDTIERLYK